DRDQHLGTLVAPPGRESDEDRRALAAGAGGRRESRDAPGMDRDLDDQLVPEIADGARERQPDRVALRDLERLEEDFVDPIALELQRLGIDLIASAGVDRQPQRELALHAGMVDLREESRLVALGERAGDLEVDEEVLADRQ